jgi:photosystem II stability/assembly factor-like uncharacterized protein
MAGSFARTALLAKLLLAAALVTVGQEPTWSTHGPNDIGLVTALAVSAGVAYAGTYNGVFRSDDSRTWQASGLSGRLISQIAADATGQFVYAVDTSGPLWVSRDGGRSWDAAHVGSSIHRVGVHPTAAGEVYAGGWDASLWKSTDSGATWRRLPTNFQDVNVWDIDFDSHDGTVYVLTWVKFFKSPDGGDTWTELGTPENRPTWMIATSAAAPGVVYASTQSGSCRSADGAATWTCEARMTVIADDLVEIPARGGSPSSLLLLAFGSLYTSSDGLAWTLYPAASAPFSAYVSVAVDESSGELFAGTPAGAVASGGLGESWNPAASGLNSAFVSMLAADAREPGQLWAGSNYALQGIFHSGDDAQTWDFEPDAHGPDYVVSLAVSPHDSTVFASSGDTLFRRRAGDSTWLSSHIGHGVRSIVFDSADARGIWLGTDTGAVHSTDGGATFAATSLTQTIYDLVVDPRRPERIYAGSYYDVESGYYYSYPEGGALFSSADGGRSWSKSQNLGHAVVALEFDPFHPETLYAGLEDGSVLRSDSGGPWQRPTRPMRSPLRSLLPDTRRPNVLYAATDQGVFRSVDRALTWMPLGIGLPDPGDLNFLFSTTMVTSLALTHDGAVLHAATPSGVWDLPLDTGASNSPCVASSTRLCLLENRFAVEMTAIGKKGAPESGIAHPLGERGGYFGIASLTGDSALPEVVIKLLPEGAVGLEGFPFFFSSMTDASFVLTLTDTVSGNQRAFASDASEPFCGTASLVPAEKFSALTRAAPAPGPLDLLGGRFSVTLEARSPSGHVATGVVIATGDNFGFFSLPDITGNAELPEFAVKILDGGGYNDAFWVFRGSLTGLPSTLTVRDNQTGAVRTYTGDAPFCGGADIAAFPN